jgi:hypothetical protein
LDKLCWTTYAALLQHAKPSDFKDESGELQVSSWPCWLGHAILEAMFLGRQRTLTNLTKTKSQQKQSDRLSRI